MRRPQKPFTVEVKRGGRTPLTPPPPVWAKPRELTVDDVFKPKATAAANEVFKPQEPASGKPAGRILDALAPELAAPQEPEWQESQLAESQLAAEAEPAAPVARRPKAAAKAAPQLNSASLSAEAPVKRGRGRPRKDHSAAPAVAAQETIVAPESVAARETVARPAVVRPTVVAWIEPALPEADLAYVAPLRNPALLSSERSAKKAALHHGRLTHSIRAEIAGYLPRGERWKRRLPKVLW